MRTAKQQLVHLRHSLAASLSAPASPWKASSGNERRAVVGCLLRTSKREDALESLFILRAFTEKENRWSGQVAFPGGHVELGETDEVACFREIKEEVGLDLRNKTGVSYLGALESAPITRSSNGSLLQLSCRVYYLENDVLSRAETKPQDAEVAASCWCPLDAVCNLDLREPYGEGMWSGFRILFFPESYDVLTLFIRRGIVLFEAH